MIDTYQGLLETICQTTSSYCHGIGGNYYNAELIFNEYSGTIIRDDCGNYVPDTAEEVNIKVRFYHDKKTQAQVDPSYNDIRTYLKGQLTCPLEYTGKFPDRVRCLLHQDNSIVEGSFQFINYIPDALSEVTSISQALGQYICGYFERENLQV